MNDLVKSLYETIPEFKKINDPFFDDFDYTVYGCFGQYLDDVAQVYKHGKIIKQNYFIEGGNIESTHKETNLLELINRSLRFIELTHATKGDHARDVIDTSFFKVVVTSIELMECSSTLFSKDLYTYMVSVWRADDLGNNILTLKS